MAARKINFGKVQNPLCVCLPHSLASLGGSGLEREVDLVENSNGGDLISV